MGNHPVRFLGEGAAAMPFPYPTPAEVGAKDAKQPQVGGDLLPPKSTLTAQCPIDYDRRRMHIFISLVMRLGAHVSETAAC